MSDTRLDCVEQSRVSAHVHPAARARVRFAQIRRTIQGVCIEPCSHLIGFCRGKQPREDAVAELVPSTSIDVHWIVGRRLHILVLTG